MVRPVRADVRVRSAPVSTSYAARTSVPSTASTFAPIGVSTEIVILFVEYRRFGHSGLPSGFSDFLVEFLGSPSSNSGGDEDDEEGDTDEAHNTEYACYGAVVVEESVVEGRVIG